MPTQRWLGLALVGLLALMAQPAAVMESSPTGASTEEGSPTEACAVPLDTEPVSDELDLAASTALVDERLCGAEASLEELAAIGDGDVASELLE